MTNAPLENARSLIPPTITKAQGLVDWLIAAFPDYNVPGTLRARAAASCYGVTQEHHHAIVHLLRANLKSAAFALVRLVFESYLRAEWLAHCATDTEIESFWGGAEPPSVNALISAIERTGAFADGELANIKTKAWRTMCAYTHSGSLQIQRWNTGDDITPSHSPEEIKEVLDLTNALALLAAIGVAELAKDEALMGRLVEKSQEYAA